MKAVNAILKGVRWAAALLAVIFLTYILAGIGGQAHEARRGDHPVDDAAGASRARHPQRITPPPDRLGLRDHAA